MKKKKTESIELLVENQPVERRGILGAVLDEIAAYEEAAFRKLNYPFEEFAQKPNPFRDDAFIEKSKRAAFQKIITLIAEYADICTDYSLWHLKEKPFMKETDKSLELQRKEIYNILGLLIPKEYRRIRKGATLRLLEFVPEVLVEWVEVYKHGMKLYDQTSKNKIKGQIAQFKEKAIKEFWKLKFINNPYPSKWYLDDSSDTAIALSFVAYFSRSRYASLKKIYYDVLEERRDQIADEVSNRDLNQK